MSKKVKRVKLSANIGSRSPMAISGLASSTELNQNPSHQHEC